jgi:hypothetical protein
VISDLTPHERQQVLRSFTRDPRVLSAPQDTAITRNEQSELARVAQQNWGAMVASYFQPRKRR